MTRKGRSLGDCIARSFCYKTKNKQLLVQSYTHFIVKQMKWKNFCCQKKLSPLPFHLKSCLDLNCFYQFPFMWLSRKRKIRVQNDLEVLAPKSFRQIAVGSEIFQSAYLVIIFVDTMLHHLSFVRTRPARGCCVSLRFNGLTSTTTRTSGSGLNNWGWCRTWENNCMKP